MKKTFYTIILLATSLHLPLSVAAAEPVQPVDPVAAVFPGLSVLPLADIGVTLYYNAALSERLTAPHPWTADMDEAGVYVARPLQSRLLGADGEAFLVDCDSGGSADPNCRVYLAGDDPQADPETLHPVFEAYALNFVFPGDGSIYVSGHTNTLFDTRRKFVYQEGEFVEVPQPFFYVGLESQTRAPLTLYAAPDLAEPVAELAAETPVTVLLNQGDDFLLKTPFGLVGWVRITVFEQCGSGDGQPSPLAGLCYAGD